MSSRSNASSGDRRLAFLTAVKAQKLDTVRWSLTHGGQTPATRDDDGYTAIHIAAAANKPKVLQLMLDLCRRSRELETIDLRDSEEMTALMMAAANGHEACVRELLYAGARPTLTCEAGLTAEAYARKRGHAALADLIARGGDDESASEDEEGGEAGEEAEETSTQRSRRKRRELAAFESRGAKAEPVPEEPPVEEEEAAEAAAAASAPPCWPEVARCLEAAPKELVLSRAAGGCPDGALVDPALWRCASLNLLQLQLSGEGGARPLTALPDGLGRLTGLRTLILSHNGLQQLPDVFASLPALKVFEAASNALRALPPSFARLLQLETLLLSGNALAELSPLAPLGNLVSVTLDGNALTELHSLGVGNKPRLALLSARSNRVARIPPELAACALLQQLLLRANALTDLPCELCGLKKLRDLEVEENPLEEPKLRKMLAKPATFLKEVLPFLKKRGPTACSAPSPAAGAPPAAAARPAPPPAAAAAAASAAAPPPPAAAAAAGSDSEEEESGGKARRPAGKKERAKAERKALEERQKAAQEALRQKEAAAAASREPATAEEEEEESEDEADLVRRKPAANFLYALSPEERERLEREEAARLRAKAEAAAAAAAAAEAAEAAAAEAESERKMRSLALKEAQSEGGVAWLCTAGVVNKVPAASLPPGAAGAKRGKAPPGQESSTYFELVCELPSVLVGRIIGKAGATIKAITERSGARISIDTGAPGMSLLKAAGRPEALESARALINNALASSSRK